MKKTRAPPAGYSIPVLSHETLFVEKKPSTLLSDWSEEYQSAPSKGIRKNVIAQAFFSIDYNFLFAKWFVCSSCTYYLQIQDVSITSSFDDWVDEVILKNIQSRTQYLLMLVLLVKNLIAYYQSVPVYLRSLSWKITFSPSRTLFLSTRLKGIPTPPLTSLRRRRKAGPHFRRRRAEHPLRAVPHPLWPTPLTSRR